MSRLSATMAQTHAVGALNVQLAAEKLVKRIYETRNPAASANEAVNTWAINKHLAYRKNDEPLLRLTELGRKYVRRELL